MTQHSQMPDGTVADSTGNWVDTWAPMATRPYLRLSRADRPIGTWLLFLPCMWGLALASLSTGRFGLHDLWTIVGCGAGAFLMRGAGCTWNDISDRDFDGSVERTKSRPIPSGQVSVRGAIIWMIVQAILAFFILITFYDTAIILGVLALLPVLIYPFAKRFTWWPQAFLGIAINWGALLAWAAHTNGLSIAPVILYTSGIAWTLFYDTIYAHQDSDDDALIGIKSTARLFGEKSRTWLRGFLTLTVCLMGLAVLFAVQERSILSLLVALGGPWALGWHLTYQLTKFDPADDASLLKIFRSNSFAGFLPLPFFALAWFL